jgi:hypothetical protein
MSKIARKPEIVKKYVGTAHFRTGDVLSIKELVDSFAGATHFTVQADHPAGPSIRLFKDELETNAEFMTRIKEEDRKEQAEYERELKLYKELQAKFAPENAKAVYDI